MTPGDDLLAEIVGLAKRHSGSSDVGPNTRLHADLGMTGDDAWEFMTAFAGKYEIDMTDFVWLRHFEDEGMDLLGPAMALAACKVSPSFAGRWQAAQRAEREITLAHLADVARAKTWRDPAEAFERARGSSLLPLTLSTAGLVLMIFFLLTGAFVTYGFFAGELGDRRVLALVGVAAMGLLFPGYLGHVSWQNIQRKLASARDG